MYLIVQFSWTGVDAVVDGGVVVVSIREQSEQLKAASAERLPAEVAEIFDRNSRVCAVALDNNRQSPAG
jgi:hypothetical protein